MQILAEARALIKKLLFIMLMIVLFSFVAQADLNYMNSTNYSLYHNCSGNGGTGLTAWSDPANATDNNNNTFAQCWRGSATIINATYGFNFSQPTYINTVYFDTSVGAQNGQFNNVIKIFNGTSWSNKYTNTTGDLRYNATIIIDENVTKLYYEGVDVGGDGFISTSLYELQFTGPTDITFYSFDLWKNSTINTFNITYEGFLFGSNTTGTTTGVVFLNNTSQFFNNNTGFGNLTISAPGYFSKILINTTVSNTNINNIYLLKQNYNGSELAIKDFWSNNNITTASINISETDYQTANITVSAPGYFGQTFTNYNISTLFTTILTPSATINTIFLEEITSLIKNNVTFDLIGDSYSRQFTTNNGTSFIANLSAGTYEIRFSLNDLQYRPRSYYLIIPLQDSGQANFTLRVLPENQSQIFTRRIVDQNSQPLSNSIFELQRYYTNSSSWVTVERALVSTQGDAVFSAVPNTQAYRYRVYDSEFTLLETSNSFFLIDTTSEIRISDTSDLLANYNSYRNTISSLSISNSSNLVLEYNDPSGTTQEVCLFVSYSYQSNVTTTNTCSQETSTTIVQQINQSAPGRYDIIATAEFNDGEVFLISNQNFKFDSTDGQQFIGILAWLVLLMGFAVCAVLSYINPIPGVVFMFFMLLAFSPYVLGMVEVSTVATSTVGVIALITLLIFFRYR